MLNNGRAGRRVPTDSDRAAACTSSLSCEGARRIALTAAMLRAVLNEKRSRVNIMSLAAADRPGNKQTRTARREISHRRHSIPPYGRSTDQHVGRPRVSRMTWRAALPVWTAAKPFTLLGTCETVNLERRGGREVSERR